MERLRGYKHIWVFDWEYIADPGEPPVPVCLVAVDLVSGDIVRRWRTEFEQGAPFSTEAESLFICFSGVGDISCFLVLGWPLPQRLVDMYPEVRQQLFDRDSYRLPSLTNAARLLGLVTMEDEFKDTARDLIINRQFTDADSEYLLDYCQQDVELTEKVFQRIYPVITDSVPRWNGCLLRGRYTCAMARIELNGVPLDTESLQLALKHWEESKDEIVKRLDTGGVYEGTHFREYRFEQLLSSMDIPWSRLESGRLDLEDNTFRERARIHGGTISNIREVRYALSKMRLNDFVIGKDGRNRTWLGPYGSVTGRNQPSNSKFIFGSARWSRSFIRPDPGTGLFYCDWGAQEIAIAAALSNDDALWHDYLSDDVYTAFGIRAGIIPTAGTESTHPSERAMCKTVVLAQNYGQTAYGVAKRLSIKLDAGRQLVQLHRESYPTFHKWVRQQAQAGSLGLPLRTPFFWERRMKSFSQVNLRSLQNFHMQGTGADMMRLAACMLTEAGIRVCCPVHDAFLIEAPLDELDRTIAATEQIMGDASEILLGAGYRTKTDVKVITYPDVYKDEGAGDLYDYVMSVVADAEGKVQVTADPSH